MTPVTQANLTVAAHENPNFSSIIPARVGPIVTL